MGYYPTIFPEKFLKLTNIDFIILDEPELKLKKLCLSLLNNNFKNIDGIAFKKNDNIIVNSDYQNIDINSLSNINWGLCDLNKYSEPFMPKPFITIETSRGCPYECNYCIKTYGKNIRYKNIENIILEIENAIKNHNIKSFRIMDDTFTINKKRLIEFCKLLIKKDFDVKWTCLSRIDNIEDEKLKYMQKAGCKRIYFGIESGSQNILNTLNKGFNKNIVLENFKLIKKYKIETATFFMVGMPFEKNKDFLKSIDLAKKLSPDFLLLCKYIPYPKTTAFENSLDKINFNLYPYQNLYSDKKLNEIAIIKEKIFFKEFYFRPIQIFKTFILLLKYPKQTLEHFFKLIKWIKNKKNKYKEDFI